MKNLRMSMLCLCITLTGLYGSAQSTSELVREPDYNKPKLFAALPENIIINVADIDAMLTRQTGETVSFPLDNIRGIHFTGTIVSAASKYNNTIVSTVIKSDNFNGARLNLVRGVKEDGTIVYEGRILSFQHGDAYLLRKDGDRLVFVKKGFYDLVNE
jgi:hypothetical protein